jgi:hypothetical protein
MRTYVFYNRYAQPFPSTLGSLSKELVNVVYYCTLIDRVLSAAIKYYLLGYGTYSRLQFQTENISQRIFERMC